MDSLQSPWRAEALRGESGTQYVQIGNSEHVIAYSPIPSANWALITEEDWHAGGEPIVEVTQMAPLVLVPAFMLALLAAVVWCAANCTTSATPGIESSNPCSGRL
jgi:hypothetical protein